MLSPMKDWFPYPSWHSTPPDLVVGAKARGLLRAPASWVPEFVILLPLKLSGESAREAARAWQGVIERLAAGGRVLVRSDGPTEHARPGVGTTVVTDATAKDIRRALTRIGANDRTLWPLLQTLVEPAAVGGLSNDRRLSPRRDLWVAEGPVAKLRPGVVVLRSKSASCVPIGSLDSGSDLRTALRQVAAVCGDTERRTRIEWLWDGSKVWVVQVDVLTNVETDPIACRNLRIRRPSRWHLPPPAAPQLDAWDGPKAESHRIFSALGLPTVPLFARRGDAILAKPRDTVAWLQSLLDYEDQPVVLRTDASADSASRELLPTSTPSRDPEELAAFARQAIVALHDGQVPLCRTAILASPLMPAVVSAIGTLGERPSEVRIDALWGFPDGLMHLPHDSYVLDENGVDRRVRHKPECLLLTADGGRVQARLGAPFDWGRTLSDAEVSVIGRWVRQVSDLAARPIQLMVLARLAGHRGGEGLIPFHFFGRGDADPPRPVRIAFRGAGVKVRAPGDLHDLAAADWIDLRPRVDYGRDSTFLEAVGQLAHERGLPIVFAGSRLGHARYILERQGATVVLDDELSPTQPTIAVLARSSAGILRVTYVEPTDFQNKVRRTHPAMANVPWLSDAESALIPRSADRPGQVIGFIE